MKKIILFLLSLLLISSVFAEPSINCDFKKGFMSTLIEGTVQNNINNDTIKKLPVQIYCDGDYLGTTKTNGKGEFSYKVLNFPKKKCDIGDTVDVKVNFEGKWYSSSNVVEIKHKIGYADVPVQIPEFSPVILSATVITSGVLFFFLRKNF